MALIIRIGGAESNSYITVDEADVLMAGLPDDTCEWESLTPAEKEFRLRMGATLIGKLPLRGHRAYRSQALEFPRSVQNNQRVIPDEVKEAQAMMAYSVVHRSFSSRGPVTEAATGQRVSQVSLGGLLSVSFQGNALETGSQLDRLVRSVQAPIYMLLKKFISQVRGGTVLNESELEDLLTTTTTTTVTVSTTTVTTT